MGGAAVVLGNPNPNLDPNPNPNSNPNPKPNSNLTLTLTLNLTQELLASEYAGSFEPEALNERAVRVIRRVENKLTGREFGEELSIAPQVQRLIEQATSHLNLCQCYVGWCPFW